ncbi:2-polyprenyl-6-methoxyphenol hydroxylase-like FAD-dependent oxidoreductase [Thermocatellispora tengchongensis]|uniref:2-polyprenyl-6-methoxyphenol hydroxylase-like FAD-dependent oxidoreductase n=1 Tax=Thermocatellispora tengchongensis TaxID=1073253 RepID=A0A840P122_9ACTN|nr:FAD-dependent monooxygenase [Thermocatellispora tengchongensis]MBB5132166.1 2-polyprenyl-6-methoxyphenol hydroxylase-like FAD-dependent oxidoreductase [Thermocatellispora tengchongensis]
MHVLISGASVAGPVLAYWLDRHGFAVTVVERAPALRKAGGHAVDLFKPATGIVERMGLLEAVLAKRTGTRLLTVTGEGAGRPARIEVDRLVAAFSDRHVEIMRDDLSEIVHQATRDRVEYVFGDSISGLAQDPGGVDVTFERGAPRRFDLVLGADGLHSAVRRLVFGEESRYARFTGAYLSVFSMPDRRPLDGEMIARAAPGRMAAYYSAAHLDGEARALMMFHSAPLDYHHRDVARQKALVRAAYEGVGGDVPWLLDEMDAAEVFYFDSITQIHMDTWSRGRVSLAGDAGYSPGPAVGGGTSLAVVGAYVLAGELAAAGGDHERAFPAYERELAAYVAHSRRFGAAAAKRLIPATPAQVRTTIRGTRLVARLPRFLIRAAALTQRTRVRLHDTVQVKDYGRSGLTSRT